MLNVLTNDISLCNVADLYNSRNDRIRISVDYVKENDIYSYYLGKKTISSDIVAGSYYPDKILDSKYFLKINEIFNDKNLLMPKLKDYGIQYDGYSLPYSYDFPVILARKDSIPDEYMIDEIEIQEFINLSRKSNLVKTFDSSEMMKIGFSPSMSLSKDIDFFFIFNSSLKRNNRGFFFDGKEADKAFDFFYNFDNNYNFGADKTREYSETYKKIDNGLYLEKKILSFDFMPFSKALSFDKNYKIFLIKDLMYFSLKNKVISMTNKTFFKSECLEFIKFLLSREIQECMYSESLENEYYFSEIHVPVYPELISSDLTGFSEGIILDSYINNLKYFDFYDSKHQKKFFKSYYNAQDQINKGIISEKDFLLTLNYGLNH